MSKQKRLMMLDAQPSSEDKRTVSEHLIHLGSVNPELRPHIRPILSKLERTASHTKEAASPVDRSTVPQECLVLAKILGTRVEKAFHGIHGYVLYCRVPRHWYVEADQVSRLNSNRKFRYLSIGDPYGGGGYVAIGC